MAQRGLRAAVGGSEKVLKFARPSAPEYGATALNLVYQAAEVIGGIEDRARETEARAQSLCRSAAERLTNAEQRIDSCEREKRELLTATECRLQDAARALKQAHSRIADAEDQLTALEFRAQAAEADAREARQALSLVEEAIRRRLLCASPEAAGSINAVA
jgi:chromosome segregation ATPase